MKHRYSLSEDAIRALDSGDIDALLELHKVTFGGFKMEADDDPDGDEPEGDEPEGDEPEGDESDDDSDSDDDEDKPLGEKGQRALDRMKADAKNQRKTIRELRQQVAELSRNGKDDDQDEATRLTTENDNLRKQLRDAWRKIAAAEHGLPASWASRLNGDDLDDFMDDAEELAADLPNTTERRKGGGGAKEGQRKRKAPTLDEQIAEAEAAGDHARARRLKAAKVQAGLQK